MYLRTVQAAAIDTVSQSTTTGKFMTWDGRGSGGLLWHMWETIVRVLEAVGAWLLDIAPSLTWTVDTFDKLYTFLRAHPHPFHITSWAIFFGPIIILIPLLLLLEILILILFNLSFLTHGILAGSLEERFHVLKDYFMDTRESLYATVEHWTSVFNTWTTTYPPLLVLRLLSGALGLFIFIGLWNGW